MAPQKSQKMNTSSDPYADLPDPTAANDPYANMPDVSLDSLKTNLKKQGTYKMVPSSESPYFKDVPLGQGVRQSSVVEIPYGNINDARQQGMIFDPHSGDDTRYAHDLFTDLKGRGQAPSVDPTKNNEEELQNKYGVVPEPAVGTKEWFERGGLKVAHRTIDTLPTIGAAGADVAAGIPGAATGPGDVAIIAGANAAGAAAGEGAKQTLNHYLFGETQTPVDRAKHVGEQAVLGAVMGGGGKLASIPLAKAASSLGLAADESAKAGFRMLPSEAAGTKAGVFETYPKGSIFTAGKMAKWRELQNQETEKAARNLADSISSTSLSKTGSREEAGNVIRKGIEDHMDDFAKSQNVVYRQIDKAADAAGVQVPRKDVVAFAQKELDRIKRVQAETGGGGPTDSFKSQLQGIVNNKNPFASYQAMKDFRSSLLAEARSMNSLMSNSEKGLIDKLSQITGTSIEDGLKNSKNPNLASMWRSANDVTREEKEAFVKTLVKNLADKKNPEDIALVLRGNSPSAISSIGIEETRAAMGVIPKNLIPEVQKQILLDTLYEATGKGSKAFDEGAFSKKILQIGDDRGKVLFGNSWPQIKEFSELLTRIKDSSGLSGASLSNPETIKQVGRITLEAVASAVGGHSGGWAATAGAGLLPIAGEAAMWKTVAAALTHPEQAEKLLSGLRHTVRILPYWGAAGYNAVKPIHGKVNEIIEKSKQDLIGDSVSSPFGERSSVSKPKDLIEKAKQLNPTANGQTAYTHYAVNPATGHRIGSRSGREWFDVQTGARVA